jgi:hypothetical protein
LAQPLSGKPADVPPWGDRPVTQVHKKTEREAYVEALQILHAEVRRQVRRNMPASEDQKAHLERWIAWALKGRTTARLRKGIQDMLEPIIYFPDGPRAQIFSEVRRRTGVDLNDFRTGHLRRVAGIVERGRVRSKSEFATLRSHVDELEGNPLRATELAAVYQLLGEFELRLSKTGQGPSETSKDSSTE